MSLLMLTLPALAGGLEPVSWDDPRLLAPSPGQRVGFIVDSEEPVHIEVVAAGRRVVAEQTWRGEGVAVHFADLPWPVDQVRVESPDADRIRALDGEILRIEEAEPRAVAPPTPGVLPAELKAIGVTSRADWGASSGTCTSTEDDWYRMAIHHTAGSQTYGGTVQGTVQALQSYSLGTGTYCDIPYQFLVGYDGSLWEGRPYDYRSGATGGGNNDGNIAISFLGCYDADGCGTTHQVTQAMMDAGQILVHTLAALHDVPLNSDSIRGHRDWPGNSTACPGDLLHPRLDELYAPLGPRWAARLVGGSLSFDEALVMEPGSTVEVWLDFANEGSGTWTSNTKLATLPRDEGSPLEASDWLSPTRLAAVDSDTAEGGTGRFSFTLTAPDQEGELQQAFGLVEEWVSWFADDGGPSEDALVLTVRVESDEPVDTDPLDSADSASPDSGPQAWDGLPPGEQVRLGGCGPGLAPSAGGLLLALLALRRRR